MIGERLQRARKGAGLSLRALAEQAGVSHTAISKFEHGQTSVSSGQLSKLARILNVRTEYFFRPQRIALEKVEYRKRTSVSRLDRVHADVLEQAERWHELMNLYPDPPVKTFQLPAGLPDKITDEQQIEELAETIRNAWNLGLNGIPDVIDTLESNGITVIATDAAESGGKFDGLAGTVNDTPLIVVGAGWPGDRQRFTLAHELGHLALKGRTGESLINAAFYKKKNPEEVLCNRFAGAFLLPKQAFIERMGERRHTLEPGELYLLKHEFGLSMRACLFRAVQTGIVTQAVQRELYRQFSFKYRGRRVKEPGKPYPHEKTVLFKQLVYRALAEEYFGESKAAELLGITLADFRRQRKLEDAH